MSAVSEFDVCACDLRGMNLIEASAGTGKTWTICALYLRLLLEHGLEVQQILVVTFTNAATAELRDRVRRRIVETLGSVRRTLQRESGTAPAAPMAQADPLMEKLIAQAMMRRSQSLEQIALTLVKALEHFDEAAILTIHGFCQRALADVAFSAGQPFATEHLADENALQLEAVQDFWRSRVDSESFPEVLGKYLHTARDTPQTYQRILKRHLAKPLAKVQWPEPLATATAAQLASGFEESVGRFTRAFETAKSIWRDEHDAVVGCLLGSLASLRANIYRRDWVEMAAEAWEEFLSADLASAASREHDPLDRHGQLNPRDLLDSGKRPELFSASKIGTSVKRGCSAPQHAFFNAAESLLEAARHTAAQLEVLRLGLIREMLEVVGSALEKRKRDQGVVSFNDMLFLLHEALHREGFTGLAASLREQYHAALIDEFQDTDPLQFAIFNRIFADTDAPWFLVGDPKQAIYRFRNADLHVYLGARSHARTIHTLSSNQRSEPGLIAAVNALFASASPAFMLEKLEFQRAIPGTRTRKPFEDRSGLAAAAASTTSSGSGARLLAGASGGSANDSDTSDTQARTPTAALRAWELPLTFEGEPVTRAKATALSARATATEIARLLHAARAGLIRLGDRPLQAGDLAVLVPTRAQGSAVKRELGLLNVGCVELSRASVFHTAEAEEVEQVLLAIHHPARESLLRAALATELLGYDAEAIVSVSGNESGLLAWLDRFANYRKVWLNEGVGIMYRRMLREEGVSSRMLNRIDGERRLSNLLHLGELLHQAAVIHPSPDGLLRWLAERRGESSEDEAAQVRLESDRDLVQIVTIHKSKGLEFPVVFCPFLWDGKINACRSRMDGREYHDPQGRAVIDFSPYEKGSARLGEIEHNIRLEDAAERLRLIYVALTRAVYRCYLVVGTYLASARSTKRVESTRSLLNWLVAGKPASPAQWFAAARDASGISDAWKGLAADNAAHLVLEPLPTAAAQPLLLAGPEASLLTALEAPPPITPAWQFTSFSKMTRQVRHEGAATDHDLLVEPTTQSSFPASPGIATPAEDRGNPGLAMQAEDRSNGRLAMHAEYPGNPGLTRQEPGEAGQPFDLPGTDILHFPRGASAGTCLHAIFEHVDFTDRSGWTVAVEEALLAHPQAPQASPGSRPPHASPGSQPPQALRVQGVDLAQQYGSRDHLSAMALQMLSDVLSTPLPGGVVLGGLPRSQRLNELAFCLPAPRLSASALQRTLQSMNYPFPPLAFGQVEGYLQGSIDMVFAHAGRYYLVDWKSNHLGYAASDYGPAALGRAMAQNGYHLQLLLYALATTRYLRLRLPGYAHATHFGGVYYLFVRGIRPAWVLPGGTPAGVFHHLPSAETLARLDRLFVEAASPLPDSGND